MPTHTEDLTDTKLLFGLRTSQSVILTVIGQPKNQAPDLWILSSGQNTYTAIAYDRSLGRWTAPLAPGDHIVRMDAPGASWFDGEVSFTVSAECTIVVCDRAKNRPPVSWAGTNGVVNDPKYPSPPNAAARPVTGGDWLCGTLQALYGRLVPLRCGPDQSALLADDAAVPPQ